MNDNPATLRTAARSCHNWLPHSRHPPLLCRGEEALTASTLTKRKGHRDPLQYSGGVTQRWLCQPHIYTLPKGRARGLGYEICSSSLPSGTCLTPRREQKYWNSGYVPLLSGPVPSPPPHCVWVPPAEVQEGEDP